MFQPALVALLYHSYAVVEGQPGVGAPGKPGVGGGPPLLDFFVNGMDENKNYNPNPGYEPYWADGAWVFVDEDMVRYGSTTKMVLVCGEECNYLFKRVKEVCGKRLVALRTEGCTSSLFKFCDGAYPDALLGFYTFKTYCEFLNYQCHHTFDYYWVLVHVGPCLHQNDVFKPVNKEHLLFERLKSYFSTLEDVFRNASLPSPLGITYDIETTSVTT